MDFDIFGKIVDKFLSQTNPAGTGNGYDKFHNVLLFGGVVGVL
jgi:hypothetical protein